MPDEQTKTVDELMSIRDVEGIDLPDGDTGEGLKFSTNRGDFNAILHRAPDTYKGIIWVCGARGGFGGPAAPGSDPFAGGGVFAGPAAPGGDPFAGGGVFGGPATPGGGPAARRSPESPAVCE